MNHTFNVSIANAYGLEESILLENIVWWCKRNFANNQNIEDGFAWTYNSISAFSQIFTYMTVSKIRNALQHLENEGLIITKVSKNTMDRSKWYAVTQKGCKLLNIAFLGIEEKALSTTNAEELEDKEDIINETEEDEQTHLSESTKASVKNNKSICQNSQMHLSKSANASVKNNKSICQNSQMHLSKSANASAKTSKCISQNQQMLLNNSYKPDINTDINSNINTNTYKPDIKDMNSLSVWNSLSVCLYKIWQNAGLPCSPDKNFMNKDIKILASAIRELSYDTLLAAINNYIKVVGLMPNKTWWTILYPISDFVKPDKIQRFLPGFFRLENFTDKKINKGCAVAVKETSHVEVNF